MSGSSEKVIAGYLTSSDDQYLLREWSPTACPGDENYKLIRFEIRQGSDVVTSTVSTRVPLEVRLTFCITKRVSNLQVGIELVTGDGTLLFQTFHSDSDGQTAMELGIHCLSCVLPEGILNEGAYTIRPLVALYFTKWIIGSEADTDLKFRTVLDHPRSQMWYRARTGALAPFLKWHEIEQ